MSERFVIGMEVEDLNTNKIWFLNFESPSRRTSFLWKLALSALEVANGPSEYQLIKVSVKNLYDSSEGQVAPSGIDSEVPCGGKEQSF